MAYPSPPANLYERLEVGAGASPEQLRAAFRRLSKTFHPDTTELPEAQASELFNALQEAITILSDPDLRRQYDFSIQQVLIPERRALSGGEWFALLLLCGALIFSLMIGVGLALSRAH